MLKKFISDYIESSLSAVLASISIVIALIIFNHYPVFNGLTLIMVIVLLSFIPIILRTLIANYKPPPKQLSQEEIRQLKIKRSENINVPLPYIAPNLPDAIQNPVQDAFSRRNGGGHDNFSDGLDDPFLMNAGLA